MPHYIDIFLSVVRDNETAQAAVIAVLFLILADWCFGLANAIIHHEFNSERMREGFGHKCAEIGLLLVAIIADGALLGGVDIGYSAPVFTICCVYLCAMEIGSLLEIFAEMNPDLANSGPFKLLASTGEPENENDA